MSTVSAVLPAITIWRVLCPSRRKKKMILRFSIPLVSRNLYPREDLAECSPCLGYKPTAAKTAEEYAKLDAEDESLARWKASLGIVPGVGGTANGPKVCH